MPKISIVLPIYNEEKYLDRAIQSVRDQSLKDIEIICVNDGSTDRSMDIIMKHASEDERIIIIDKKNAGYGNSMNLGIDRATGEYVGVVETDDYVLPIMFETLYNKARELDLDLVKSDHYKFMSNSDGGEIKEYYSLTNDRSFYNRVINPQEETGVFNLIMMTWSGIYKRSFLTKYDIRHNETPGASFQDNGFWFQVFTQAERAYFIDKAFYMLRRDNPNSSVKSKSKVYAMSTEYDFIGNFLSKAPGRMERYKYIYQYHRCIAYHFTLKRISHEFVYEFLHKFSSDFKEPMEHGLLRQEDFSPLIWKYTNIIIKDPDYFYCWKHYDSRYEENEPKDIIIKYYKMISNNYKKELREIKKSNTYRIGRFFTYIPRLISKASKIYGEGGIKAIKTAIHIWAYGNTNRRLKVLFVASDNNAASGAFLSMAVLCDYLQTEHNTQVKVILPRSGTGEAILDDFHIGHSIIRSYDWVVGLDEKRDGAFRIKKIKEHLWNYLSAVKIGREIRKEGFDVVHINTTYAYVGALSAYYAKRPVVWHLREFLEEDQGREIWCKERGIELISDSDRIIAISDAVYDKYKDRLGNKLIRIYNGIDARKFHVPDHNILVNSPPVFIFVGGLSVRKGCFFLIDALEEYALRSNNDFRVIFVGRGNEKFLSRINNSSIKSKIEYVGYQKDTVSYYKQSDIAFTCSDSEAFGRITVEAMMSGCLVIGVNSGGTREIISDRKTGLLYDKGNIDSIIDAINFSLNDKDQSREIASAGRNHALKNFSAENNANKVSDLYSGIEIRKNSPIGDKFFNALLSPFYALACGIQILYESTNDLISSKRRNEVMLNNKDDEKIKLIEKKMNGTVGDLKEAYRLCLELAENGNSKAQLMLSSMINEGKGTDRDSKKAMMWLRSAADGGNTKAIISLIDVLSKSESNQQEAYELCKKLAETGHDSAQYRLGLFHRDGIGTEKNPSEAKQWLQSSAKRGNKKAQNVLIAFLMEGSLEDQAAAYVECLIAAEAGNEEAQYTLSDMYIKGIGVEKNEEKSMFWLRRSVNNGSNKAKVVLIDHLSKGDDRDLKEAYNICLSLAETGHLGAQYRLGLMYWNGKGIEKNIEDATKWITASANGGYEKSKAFLDRNLSKNRAG